MLRFALSMVAALVILAMAHPASGPGCSLRERAAGMACTGPIVIIGCNDAGE